MHGHTCEQGSSTQHTCPRRRARAKHSHAGMYVECTRKRDRTTFTPRGCNGGFATGRPRTRYHSKRCTRSSDGWPKRQAGTSRSSATSKVPLISSIGDLQGATRCYPERSTCHCLPSQVINSTLRASWTVIRYLHMMVCYSVYDGLLTLKAHCRAAWDGKAPPKKKKKTTKCD